MMKIQSNMQRYSISRRTQKKNTENTMKNCTGLETTQIKIHKKRNHFQNGIAYIRKNRDSKYRAIDSEQGWNKQVSKGRQVVRSCAFPTPLADLFKYGIRNKDFPSPPTTFGVCRGSRGSFLPVPFCFPRNCEAAIIQIRRKFSQHENLEPAKTAHSENKCGC